MAAKIKPKSPYEEMKAAGVVRRGRRPSDLSDEERTARNKATALLSTSARNRALTVIATRYEDEYNEVLTAERDYLLANDDRFDILR